MDDKRTTRKRRRRCQGNEGDEYQYAEAEEGIKMHLLPLPSSFLSLSLSRWVSVAEGLILSQILSIFVRLKTK